MEYLSISEAKGFLLNYQGLDGYKSWKGKAGVVDFIRRVGSLQYDPLNVVGRNPDLVLQSRIGGYKSSMLYELLYKERRLIDGWDKMMGLYPVEDWPFFTCLRERKREEITSLLKRRKAESALNYTDEAVEILRAEGPKLSTQIDFGKTAKGAWGHGKVAGATLDYLFHTGRAGVSDKRGTQKVYDLIERLLPPEILSAENPFFNRREFHKWLILRRIGTFGIYWNRSNVVWQGIDGEFKSKSYRDRLFHELTEEGLLREVEVEGLKRPFYRKADLDLEAFRGKSRTMYFLAPLDNLLWDRKLILRLFGFDYKWEVYTPVKQRKYGYYVLPMLWGNDFIGRIEPVIDRETNELVIKNIWLEGGVRESKGYGTALKAALQRFVRFTGTKGFRMGDKE
ncbi:MAG: crosslink repair DNA glycosylase YcaQ family protein [Spirochaetales bacterium]|nr:crosslink repair DNA glycosylase YcaQ family protein [Spirochaetales bacterium]